LHQLTDAIKAVGSDIPTSSPLYSQYMQTVDPAGFAAYNANVGLHYTGSRRFSTGGGFGGAGGFNLNISLKDVIDDPQRIANLLQTPRAREALGTVIVQILEGK
jgi:hypothetical protein